MSTLGEVGLKNCGHNKWRVRFVKVGVAAAISPPPTLKSILT